MRDDGQVMANIHSSERLHGCDGTNVVSWEREYNGLLSYHPMRMNLIDVA